MFSTTAEPVQVTLPRPALAVTGRDGDALTFSESCAVEVRAGVRYFRLG